jgi:chemotaxis signal transduction protein
MSGPMFVPLDVSKSPTRGPGESVAVLDTAGYVVFLVAGTRFAVSVLEVLEVLRSAGLRVLPGSGHEINGRALGLVDARGHSVAVIDLRIDPEGPGDVLIPVDAMHVGVVVDRVESVLDRESLRLEDGDVHGLPAYARGVLRRPDGSGPVLLISMPTAPSLADEHDSNTIFAPETAPIFT